ncbi:helix-turn-helix transcriptional regulator [Ideonella livida]|uniref:Helix-turn-helix domain-containing protein n=1 Tax=Ideonella livida TaxID=2707176 RepID=A0A7C9PI97_9BURK|nr:helix-turn-helix transcriptional regulator [Ideonella livida]NDY92488.1 helix-turn-helix domain-containing protein [Ideonella livida]
MPTPHADARLHEEQRRLRALLLDGPQALRWQPARDLAAHLLLYLDDPARCWQITADWLCRTVHADRVDAGPGGYGAGPEGARDYVVLVESQRRPGLMPSMLGRRVPATEPGVRQVWASQGLCVLPHLSEQRQVSAGTRALLAQAGTAAKLALGLAGRRPVGLICADWEDASPHWQPGALQALPALCQQLLAPVLETAQALAAPDTVGPLADGAAAGGLPPADPDLAPASGHPGHLSPWLARLTPAERKVARLVAQGLSYKEVARALDRSTATIDHQLRSIRAKLGVASTARLVRVLAGG